MNKNVSTVIIGIALYITSRLLGDDGGLLAVVCDLGGVVFVIAGVIGYIKEKGKKKT